MLIIHTIFLLSITDIYGHKYLPPILSFWYTTFFP